MIAAIPPYASFMNSGSTGPFTFAFVFDTDNEIVCNIKPSNGSLRPIYLGSQYTLSGAGSDSGGIVNLVEPLGDGEMLIIQRVLPIEQTTSLPDQGPYFASTIEKALDHLVMICQQIQSNVDHQAIIVQLGTGPAGPQGPTGFIGPMGYQGPQGVIGYQGAQGHIGPQGYQGFQGQPGSQGFQGLEGHQGYQGSPGPQGYQGNDGGPGAQGNPGIGLNARGAWASGQNYAIGDWVVYSNNSYVCYLGLTNSTSNPGADTTHFALLGAIGSQGPQGNQGAQGTIGPQGYVGSQGYSGPQGLSGSQGPQGVQGLIGPQGYGGSQGPPGSQGNQGSQGVNMLVNPVALGGGGYDISNNGGHFTLQSLPDLPAGARWIWGWLYQANDNYFYMSPTNTILGAIGISKAGTYPFILPILTPQTVWCSMNGTGVTEIHIQGYTIA